MLLIHRPEILFTTQKIFSLEKECVLPSRWNESAEVVLWYAVREGEWQQEWEIMLSRMMGVCHFTMEKVLQLNAETDRVPLSTVQKRLSAKLILLFGDIRLGRNIGELPLHRPVHLGKSVIIRTLDISKLGKDSAAKEKLWRALQIGLQLKK